MFWFSCHLSPKMFLLVTPPDTVHPGHWRRSHAQAELGPKGEECAFAGEERTGGNKRKRTRVEKEQEVSLENGRSRALLGPVWGSQSRKGDRDEKQKRVHHGATETEREKKPSEGHGASEGAAEVAECPAKGLGTMSCSEARRLDQADELAGNNPVCSVRAWCSRQKIVRQPGERQRRDCAERYHCHRSVNHQVASCAVERALEARRGGQGASKLIRVVTLLQENMHRVQKRSARVALCEDGGEAAQEMTIGDEKEKKRRK